MILDLGIWKGLLVSVLDGIWIEGGFEDNGVFGGSVLRLVCVEV